MNSDCQSLLRNFLSLSDIIIIRKPQSADIKNLSKAFAQSIAAHIVLPGMRPICLVYLSVIVKIQLLPLGRHGSPKTKSNVIV